jgi:hypothetical protein
MAFDILFIASDSEGAAFFHPERHEYLQTKYGLKAEEVRQLVFASAPAWVQDGVPMSYTAAENWFRNGRRFSLTQAEIDQYLDDQSRENLTRFGNGIYVSDHLLRQGLSVRLINDLGPEWQKFLRNAAEGPRVVAISTTFLESRERTEACARRVREVLPDVPIVIGGPLVHYSHKILHEAPHLASHASL